MREFFQEWLCSISFSDSAYDTERQINVCMEGYRRYTSKGLFMALIRGLVLVVMFNTTVYHLSFNRTLAKQDQDQSSVVHFVSR